MTKAVTINLDDARAAELERIARESGVSVEELLRDVIEFYALDQPELPPLTEEEKAAIQRGREDIRAGRVVSQEDVEKELRERFGP